MNNGDMPAHPMKPEVIGGNHQVYLGLTKREHLAAMAMQGLLAHPNYQYNGGDEAEAWVTIADDLLAALEKS